eukprot:TRINITY_DN5053_c0_g1_i1.p1 TRINITY_DN5053_c0_g1~~TRINITY_DN5053_c0_g1_i1.p1  ORF type:complete len:275 (-),score=69.45 TRINITY_DN5053_c0_g1_i1:535-1359(-)
MNEISRVIPQHLAKISEIFRDHPQFKTGALVIAGLVGTYVSFLALVEPEEVVDLQHSRSISHLKLEDRRKSRSNASSQTSRSSKSNSVEYSRGKDNNAPSKPKSSSFWIFGNLFGSKTEENQEKNASRSQRNSLNSSASSQKSNGRKGRNSKRLEMSKNTILTSEKDVSIQLKEEFPKEDAKEFESQVDESGITEAFIAEQRALQDKIKQLLTRIERQTYEIDCLSKTAQLYEGQFRVSSYFSFGYSHFFLKFLRKGRISLEIRSRRKSSTIKK